MFANQYCNETAYHAQILSRQIKCQKINGKKFRMSRQAMRIIYISQNKTKMNESNDHIPCGILNKFILQPLYSR